MLEEYSKLTKDILVALKREDYVQVSILLDSRSTLLSVLEKEGSLSLFKSAYKGSKAYKDDLDIEYMLYKERDDVLIEIDVFNKSKGGNMAYINTLRDDVNIFIAKV